VPQAPHGPRSSCAGDRPRAPTSTPTWSPTNPDEAVRLKAGSDGSLDEDSPSSFNLRTAGNRYDTDFSTELATGDFDGDGQADVFVANGTAWFFSRAGIGPWEFLRASNKRVGELGFADVTRDGVTDVLYRDPAGALGYVDSGRAAPLTPVTTSPVPIKDLRFGDFDGDSRTDIFYTLGGQWNVWYGRTRTWTPTQTSSQPISGLLFGEFDDVHGTDVAAVTAHDWSYSSASTQSWARLNRRVADSFATAVAADFDGNGRTDITFGDAETWRISLDGSAPLTLLRDGSVMEPYALKGMQIGRFDGGTRAGAIGFQTWSVPAFPPTGPAGTPSRRVVVGERLVSWRGIGTGGDALTVRSRHNMR
jgi:hypothetical protein